MNLQFREGGPYLYRYVDYGTEDFYGVRLELQKFTILKETPCGAWIDIYRTRSRFVNLQARKKYACRTEAEALEGFIHRKRRQLRILKAQTIYVEDALERGEELQKKMQGGG